MADDPAITAAFAHVELPSYLPCDASPEIPEGERGIRIAAPARVVVAPRMRVPVCAAAVVVDSPVPRGTNLWDGVVAVVMDTRNNRAWAAALADPNRKPMDVTIPAEGGGGSPAAAGPAQDDDDPRFPPGTEVVSPEPGFCEFGNFDLRELMPIPAEPASLVIHFTLGHHQSNVVRVDVVRDREIE